MSDEHERLVDVLAEFAATMVTDSSVHGVLDYLVTRIVDVLPITAAGATLLWLSGEPRYVAASDPEGCGSSCTPEVATHPACRRSGPAARSQPGWRWCWPFRFVTATRCWVFCVCTGTHRRR